MAAKCVHKGCGKTFVNPDEDCVYHPGPPVFHEGQKGWNCCKQRVLTFDEFLSIPPCTTGKHSTIDNSPALNSKSVQTAPSGPSRTPRQTNGFHSPAQIAQAPSPAPPIPTAEPETEEDNPELPVLPNMLCRRRGCGISSTTTTATSREGEQCIHHSGFPLFHEGSKGWTCCKRRVLEFDEFLRIEGCKKKDKHLFVGSGIVKNEKIVDVVRHDFYQTATRVHASIYLKQISKSEAMVRFSSSTTVELDLPTSDKTRYKASWPLYGPVDTEASSFKILGTKLELELKKADASSWPVLRADERPSGNIIQVGNPGMA